MKIGVQMQLNADATDSDALRNFVGEIEQLGFESLWLGDHIIIPGEIKDVQSYPYAWRFDADLEDLFPSKSFVEAVAMAGFIAGASSRIDIGVGVFVVPMRNPILLAKQLATLDVVSNGRLIAGVGAGWLREEFEVLDVDFDNRGKRFDEAIDVMHRLWGDDQPTGFDGNFWKFDPVYCLPRPLRRPAPRLWVGGHTKHALRRCARFATGWHAIELAAEEFRTHNASLDAALELAGRDPRSVTRSLACRLPLSDEAGVRRSQSLIQEYKDAGCEHLIVYTTPRRTLDENLARYRRLSSLIEGAMVA